MNSCDCTSIKLYVHNQVASWIWPIGYIPMYSIPEEMTKVLVILVAHVPSKGGEHFEHELLNGSY